MYRLITMAYGWNVCTFPPVVEISILFPNSFQEENPNLSIYQLSTLDTVIVKELVTEFSAISAHDIITIR